MSYPQPGQGPYGQQPQQGGYPQYNYPPGSYPNKPPRPPGKKGGIIASIAIVVILLGAIAFTAFVEPGFLKKKDFYSGEIPTATLNPAPGITPPSGLGQKSTGNTQGNSGGGDGPAVLQNFVASINNGDAQGALALVCPDRQQTTEKDIAAIIGKGGQLKIENIGQDNNGTYGGKVTGTVNGAPINQPAINAKDSGNGSFCISVFLATY